ncbi:MAG: LLM class flavin-dependent oxidoreductase, partial [Candidatus Bathyarchaeota archaeon]
MKYGICLSTFNEYADPNLLADLAVEIEQSGWDSVFLWDHLIFNAVVRQPIIHPWVAMSAIASRTKHIKIGTYVTPIPRYPPWILAKETAALDILSKGRFLLGAGLGGPAIEYTAFGQQYNIKVLAEKLDES